MIAEVNGVELFYCVEGEGIPCLVPSMAGFPIYQRTLSQKLREHIQFIFVDMRACGRSTGAVEDVSFDVLADDMDQLRNKLGFDKTAILGHSAHGLLALECTRRSLSQTSHVVLIGSPAEYTERFQSKNQERWASAASEQRKEALQRNLERAGAESHDGVSPGDMFIRQYVAMGPMYWFDPEFDAMPLWKDHIVNMDVTSRFFGDMLENHDITSSFPSITAPVFIAHGEYDFSVAASVWDGVRDKFPDATYCLFERSGHHPQFEEQELFDEKFIEWLASH